MNPRRYYTGKSSNRVSVHESRRTQTRNRPLSFVRRDTRYSAIARISLSPMPKLSLAHEHPTPRPLQSEPRQIQPIAPQNKNNKTNHRAHHLAEILSRRHFITSSSVITSIVLRRGMRMTAPLCANITGLQVI
jgi:hypothetical protein